MNKRRVLIRRLLSVLAVVTMFVAAESQIVPIYEVRASDTGWRVPTADAADTGGDGNGFEVNPMEAYADGDDYARNMNGYNDRHRFYNFGFDSSIPTDAIITGIEVRLDGWADSASNTPRYEVELSGNGGVNWTASRSTSTLNTSEGTFYLGGQNDLWQSAWEVSDLLDNNFRVRITSRALGTGRSNRDFFLDWITVRVNYASAHIGGIVWADDNANGVQDNAESGLSSVHVTIYQDDDDGVFEGGGDDPPVGASDTGVDGNYDTGPFSDGYGYWIDVAEPVDTILTTPPEPRLVQLSDGNSIVANFGYAPQIVPHPAIDIAKTPATQLIRAGAPVTFAIAVTNTGAVPLMDVFVLDDLAPGCAAALGALATGDSTYYSCSMANATTDFTNTATASGTPPIGSVVTDTSVAFVDVISPALGIEKRPAIQTAISGSTVTFTIVVTNTGDTWLSNVIVADALAPNCGMSFNSLVAGASAAYQCTMSNVTSTMTNTIIISGTPPVGPLVSATATAQVIVEPRPTCPPNLAAHWRLDEVGGPPYRDSCGVHPGMCAGSCPTPTPGHIAGGQLFNGVSAGINVPVVASGSTFNWGVANSFTIEFWAQTDAANTCSGNQVIVGRDGGTSNGLHWWVGCRTGGQATFYARDTSGILAGTLGVTDLTDGRWHHVVAVRDARTRELRLSVDGLLQAVTPVTYTAGFESPTAQLNIGWLNRTTGYRFNGAVDEVIIHNRALEPPNPAYRFFLAVIRKQ